MTDQIADALERAADLIDPFKGGRWIKGALHDEDGGHCTIGALAQATIGMPGVMVMAAMAVEDLLHGFGSLPAWNDEVCLDGAEAANLLRKAAETQK